jgi:hypothetical protein
VVAAAAAVFGEFRPVSFNLASIDEELQSGFGSFQFSDSPSHPLFGIGVLSKTPVGWVAFQIIGELEGHGRVSCCHQLMINMHGWIGVPYGSYMTFRALADLRGPIRQSDTFGAIESRFFLR